VKTLLFIDTHFIWLKSFSKKYKIALKIAKEIYAGGNDCTMEI
jgi:hypothetical protein